MYAYGNGSQYTHNIRLFHKNTNHARVNINKSWQTTDVFFFIWNRVGIWDYILLILKRYGRVEYISPCFFNTLIMHYFLTEKV